MTHNPPRRDYLRSYSSSVSDDNHHHGSLSEEEYTAACSVNVENLNKKAAHTFLVCVDGSDQSTVAFLSALNLRKKYDHICVFHAYRGQFLTSFTYSLLSM